MLSITGFLDLVVPLLGETNHKDAHKVTISRLHVHAGFNQGLKKENKIN